MPESALGGGVLSPGGVYLVPGGWVYLVPGGGVPSPRGVLLGGGVLSPGGVYLVPGGGVYLVPGGVYLVPGGVLLWGLCLVWGCVWSGGCLVLGVSAWGVSAQGGGGIPACTEADVAFWVTNPCRITRKEFLMKQTKMYVCTLEEFILVDIWIHCCASWN